jgi:hypothetical protein
MKHSGEAAGEDVIIVVTHRSCRSHEKPLFQMLLPQLATTCCQTSHNVHAFLKQLQPNLFYGVFNMEQRGILLPATGGTIHEKAVGLEEGEPNVTFYRKFKFEDLQ